MNYTKFILFAIIISVSFSQKQNIVENKQNDELLQVWQNEDNNVQNADLIRKDESIYITTPTAVHHVVFASVPPGPVTVIKCFSFLLNLNCFSNSI